MLISRTKDLFTKKLSILVIVVFILLLVICYSNALNNEFMMDDHKYFLDHPNIADVSLSDIFFKGFKKFYRPVCFLILRSERILFADNPYPYHVVNLVLFTFLCLFFFVILNKLTGSYELALLSSIFYAVHPINNFLINYKTASYLSFSILLVQGGLLSFLKYIEKRNITFLFLSLLFYFLSLLSHEINFIFPLCLLIVLYFINRFSFKKSLLSVLPFLIPFAAYLLIRFNISDAVKIDNVLRIGIPIQNYLYTSIKLLGWYFSKLIFPKDILFLWCEEIKSSLGPINILLLLASIGSVLFAFFRWKRSKKSFYLALFLIGLIPVYFASFTYTAATRTAVIEPHWFLFNSIGFFLLVASFLIYIKNKIDKRAWNVIIIMMVALLVFMTRTGNEVWKERIKYSYYWIEINPLNETPWNELAGSYVYYKKTEKEMLLSDFDEMLNKKQNYLVFSKRAQAYYKMSKIDKALADYNKALLIKPDYDIALNNRGMIYQSRGEYGLAIEDFNKAIDLNFNSAKTFNNRGMSFYYQGKYDQAVSDFSRAVELDPKLSQAFNNRGLVYLQKKEYDKALGDILKAKSLGKKVDEKIIKKLKNIAGVQ